MKKIAIVSLVFLFAMSLVQGQTKNPETKKEQKAERVALKKLEGTNVSEMAKNSFTRDFGNLPNVHWKRVGTYDEAAFKKDGKEMIAFYDIDANLVGTTEPKTFADIPAKGQEQIKKEYKDYTIGPIILYDDNEANSTDMIMYGIQFEDADNYFVELTKGTRNIVVQVNMNGLVLFFTELK
jgi:hypothetical protein